MASSEKLRKALWKRWPLERVEFVCVCVLNVLTFMQMVDIYKIYHFNHFKCTI